MWKFLETLAIRIEILAELRRARVEPYPITFDTVRKGAALVNHYMSTQEGRANVDPCFPPRFVTTKDRPFPCAAENCGRTYKNSDRLHTHIREAPGRGHTALKHIIDRKNCLPCRKEFLLPRSLARHEKSLQHGEKYDSRVTSFIDYHRASSPGVTPADLVESGGTATSGPHTLSADSLSASVHEREPWLQEGNFDFNSSSLDPYPLPTYRENIGDGLFRQVQFDFDSTLISSAAVESGQRPEFDVASTPFNSHPLIARNTAMTGFGIGDSDSVDQTFETAGTGSVTAGSAGSAWTNVPCFDFDSVVTDQACTSASGDISGRSADRMSLQTSRFDFDSSCLDPQIRSAWIDDG